MPFRGPSSLVADTIPVGRRTWRLLGASDQTHIVVRLNDTTIARRIRQARTVKFTERDEPLDTVLSVTFMTRASSFQLRRGGAATRSVAGSEAAYATRAMRSWTLADAEIDSVASLLNVR